MLSAISSPEIIPASESPIFLPIELAVSGLSEEVSTSLTPALLQPCNARGIISLVAFIKDTSPI